MPKQYKIEIVKEGALGTIFLGSSSLPVRKMEEVMNRYGREGWELEFQVIEKRRLALLWATESAVITFSKEVI